MKLASLLAQYLYAHKRLDLAGIGSFLLDQDAVIDTQYPNQDKTSIIEGVSFENNPGLKASSELIDFIALHSGKIRALAAADLDSHLQNARQFLNIGKPFLFDGIGSLVKTQSGNFSFNPGQVINEKLKESAPREIVPVNTGEEPMGDYKSILYLKKVRKKWKRPMTLVLIFAGLALAIWGGYTVSHRDTKTNKIVNEPAKEETMIMETSDTIVTEKKDTITPSIQPTTIPGNYKFIVEIAGKQRGLYRYGLLKGYGLDIRMETKDSIKFNLFFSLPASASDTTRMLDSLRWLYSPPGSMAFVER